MLNGVIERVGRGRNGSERVGTGRNGSDDSIFSIRSLKRPPPVPTRSDPFRPVPTCSDPFKNPVKHSQH